MPESSLSSEGGEVRRGERASITRDTHTLSSFPWGRKYVDPVTQTNI